MWIYATISPKLVEMIVDVDSTAHGVWNRLKDLFHDNKDARITQLDNEIRNMAIGNLPFQTLLTFFQQLKSKADRLANLESPVKDTSLVTYAINGVRSKYPDAARVIRLREKAPTFDEFVGPLMLTEESDMSNTSHCNQVFHNTSSSPTVLVASTSNANKMRTMSTSGLDVCRNFQRGSCTYGARCKFVHGANDLRPRPFECFLRQLLKAHQFQSAQQFQPAQQLQYGLSGPPGFGSPNMKPIAPPQASHQATMLPHAFQTMTLQEPAWNMDTGASSHLAENTVKDLPDPSASVYRL
ncbi:Toll/interleukin-1 receptor domain-containing protein [Tanacetum coccineum]